MRTIRFIIRKILWWLFAFKPFKRAAWALYKEYELHNATKVEQALRKKLGHALTTGPFKGLRYPNTAHMGYLGLAPKYLGTFEHELFEVLETVKKLNYRTVLNIGSADGYYSVGFAKVMPNAKVIAWEMLPEMRSVTKAVAELNDVSDRLELRNVCTVDELTSLKLDARTLIFSDCEGTEDDLLKPELLKGLKEFDIIVECHEMFREGVTQRLIDRFSATHDIRRIEATERTLDDVNGDFVDSVPLSKHEVLRSFEEPRLYHMHWLFISQRQS